ncbi:cytochrome b561/ferric reductase transmembrane domain-containing protein [Roseibium sp. TrichSKD4]|uniref:cytochrome b561 domain-containing protein n=1 Tax=Roseibium sp. TrichSKD4 TaxID=744980 RepID=UPI0001E56F1A|nr:cytochrome b561 domain-containing protein [Roseibium sp. TrichSKD4]EFO32070.1 cytochrome b561/ferric reductase transmembrane domain-containing protein [Roseibium sp. TrichSKD4]
MLDWLLSPIDPDRAHDVGVYVSWHARLMVVAWAGLAPVGVLGARFFKIWPGQDWPRELDNQNWWILHRFCQYGAVTLSFIALGLLLLSQPLLFAFGHPHAFIGWSVVLFALFQVAGGLMRGTKGGPTDIDLRGDHYDMTSRRVVFEYIHKYLGYATLACAVAAVVSGLWQANAPRWMWGVIGIWWTVLIIAFAYFQRQKMAIDTYQAIWGSDEALPGNSLKPIGIGVARPDEAKQTPETLDTAKSMVADRT